MGTQPLCCVGGIMGFPCHHTEVPLFLGSPPSLPVFLAPTSQTGLGYVCVKAQVCQVTWSGAVPAKGSEKQKSRRADSWFCSSQEVVGSEINLRCVTLENEGPKGPLQNPTCDAAIHWLAPAAGAKASSPPLFCIPRVAQALLRGVWSGRCRRGPWNVVHVAQPFNTTREYGGRGPECQRFPWCCDAIQTKTSISMERLS